MKGLRTLFVSNWKEFSRDRVALFWTLAFPVLFIIIFGLVFSGADDTEYDVGIVAPANDSAAQGLIQAFAEIPVLNVHHGEEDAELAALKDGERRAVVAIPEGLGQAVAEGRTSTIQVYYDASQVATGQVVQTIVERVLNEAERRATGRPDLLQVEAESIQSDRLRNIDYLLPGILAMAVMQLGVYSAMPMVSMREKNILKRLEATPLRRHTLITGQILLRLTIAIVQAGLIIAVGRLLFDVQMVGSWTLLTVWVILGALTFIALGFLLAAFAKSEESGNALIQMMNFPMMFLSGIFFPVEFMPDFIRPVVRAIPLTYFADALRQVMVDASALYQPSVDALVLGGWLLVAFLGSVRFFRWETQG